jgi:hypothetical protein
VQYAEHPEEWRTMLTCAKWRLVFFGDAATLTKHSPHAKDWEAEPVRRLLALCGSQTPQSKNPAARVTALA